jgi:virulence-associated protein VapD
MFPAGQWDFPLIGFDGQIEKNQPAHHENRDKIIRVSKGFDDIRTKLEKICKVNLVGHVAVTRSISVFVNCWAFSVLSALIRRFRALRICISVSFI